MKRNLIIAGILGLLSSGTVAAALECTVPTGAAFFSGPYLPFTQLLQCSNGAGVNGLGQGAFAGGGKPKRICADLVAGTRATADGFNGQFGTFIQSCRKHDSTVNGTNICTTVATACTAATHQTLFVKN